jgi:NAD dependent epimerase/dehydratase family enzyme
MGDRLLLQGQHVVPARLQDASFVFYYPDVRSALQASLCDFGLN